MKQAARFAVVTAGAGGLLLCGAATALARPADSAWAGRSTALTEIQAKVRCDRAVRLCANSGNLKDSQNIYVTGNLNNAANPNNSVDSPNSNNSVEGDSHNSRNYEQYIIGTRR